QAAKSGTSTIPVVFLDEYDPVPAGIAARPASSLARPGSNLTGISVLAGKLTPKRVELLLELVPQATVIALLVNPDNPTAEGIMREAHEAAVAKGIGVLILKAGTEREIDAAFAKLPAPLLVSSDPFFDSRREQLVGLASRHAI